MTRIGELPSELLENILGRLPLAEAARTSFLSKEWRYNWINIPELCFDDNVPSQHHIDAEQRLERVVDKVLLRHTKPIRKFFLCQENLESCSDFNNWIICLSTKAVSDFSLLITGYVDHILPSHFYSFNELKHLNLSRCVLMPPSTFKGFDKLISLSLFDVELDTIHFDNFISKCPRIEELKLDSGSNFEFLVIKAPCLKSLDFSGSFKTMCIKSCPILASVSVHLYTHIYDMEVWPTSNIRKVFGGMTSLEKLVVRGLYLRFLAVGLGNRQRVPSSFQNLKHLYLDVSFDKVDELACTLCIIRSSPNLESLDIHGVTDKSASMDGAVEYLRNQNFSDCSMRKLQDVTLRNLSDLEPELELIRLLLANLTGLLKISIVISDVNVTDGGLQLLKNMIQHPRASPEAQIYFS